MICIFFLCDFQAANIFFLFILISLNIFLLIFIYFNCIYMNFRLINNLYFSEHQQSPTSLLRFDTCTLIDRTEQVIDLSHCLCALESVGWWIVLMVRLHGRVVRCQAINWLVWAIVAFPSPTLSLSLSLVSDSSVIRGRAAINYHVKM